MRLLLVSRGPRQCDEYTLTPPARSDLGQPTTGAAANHGDAAQRIATYHLVAQRIVEKTSEGLALIQGLKALQDASAFAASVPASFVSVVASSGTGKTQLAVTSARAFQDDDKVHVLYLYMGGGDAEAVQAFYQPHTALGRVLFDLIKKREDWTSQESPKPVSAGALITDDNKKLLEVFGVLWHLLQTAAGVKVAGRPPQLSFYDLRTRIVQLLDAGHRFLVFMDEAPPESNRVGFFVVISMRNIMRALGIAPILMSTHTGAHNAVPTRGADSRGGESNTWVHLVSKLPGAVVPEGFLNTLSGKKNKKNLEAFFLEAAMLDRPLISNMMQDFIAAGCGEEKKSHDEEQEDDAKVLQRLLHAIAKQLWTVKLDAWTADPFPQLMQLVKVERDVVSDQRGGRRRDAHQIVGNHFGRAEAQSGVTSSLGHELGWQEAKSWASTSHVLLPSPAREPLLVLSLLLWAPPGGPPFPLLGPQAEPLTVLGAYKLCQSKFKAAASLSNDMAASNDGNLLEALAHAATTLASFSCGLAGTDLFTFLAFLWRLLGTELSPQDVLSLRAQATALSASIAKHAPSLASLHVPILPPTNSRFPPLLHLLDGVSAGFLDRPANKEMRDGHFDDMQHETNPRFVMECKNVEGGLTGTVFEKCLLRVPEHANLLVLFTLSTQKDGYFAKASMPKSEDATLITPEARWKTFCASCKHPAFQDASSQLCILELRDPASALDEAVVPVRICGQPQVGQPGHVSLLVVILLVPLQQ